MSYTEGDQKRQGQIVLCVHATHAHTHTHTHTYTHTHTHTRARAEHSTTNADTKHKREHTYYYLLSAKAKAQNSCSVECTALTRYNKDALSNNSWPPHKVVEEVIEPCPQSNHPHQSNVPPHSSYVPAITATSSCTPQLWMPHRTCHASLSLEVVTPEGQQPSRNDEKPRLMGEIPLGCVFGEEGITIIGSVEKAVVVVPVVVCVSQILKVSVSIACKRESAVGRVRARCATRTAHVALTGSMCNTRTRETSGCSAESDAHKSVAVYKT